MTALLPPHLQKVFAPRPPLIYLRPLSDPPGLRRTLTIDSIAQHFPQCKDHDPNYKKTESPSEAKQRRKRENTKLNQEKIEKAIENWDPNAYKDVTDDPFNTLFVGRLSYDTSERTLVREMERFGNVKKIKMISYEGKSRGYAFVEFEKERDLKNAFRDADGIRLDGRRIVVDVERGRTVKEWRPRRLGGGLGKTRLGGPKMNQKYSGRDVGIRSKEAETRQSVSTVKRSDETWDRKRGNEGGFRRRSRSPPRRDGNRGGFHDNRDGRDSRDRFSQNAPKDRSIEKNWNDARERRRD